MIQDERMRDFVHGLMPSGTWIGLNDKEREGTWKTWNGRPAPYLHWADGEPNNQLNNQGGHWAREDCVMLDDNNKMNDAMCIGRRSHFVCQIADDLRYPRFP